MCLGHARCARHGVVQHHDLATCIALEWGDPESRTSRAGQHFTVRNVNAITLGRENQMKLEVYGEEAEHARFGASGEPQVPFEMSAGSRGQPASARGAARGTRAGWGRGLIAFCTYPVGHVT